MFHHENRWQYLFAITNHRNPTAASATTATTAMATDAPASRMLDDGQWRGTLDEEEEEEKEDDDEGPKRQQVDWLVHAQFAKSANRSWGGMQQWKEDRLRGLSEDGNCAVNHANRGLVAKTPDLAPRSPRRRKNLRPSPQKTSE